MNLGTYLSGQRGRSARLARAIGVTPVSVHQWWHKGKPVPTARCPAIERETAGLVTCEELRPDVDWQFLRGTAAKAGAHREGA